MQQNIIGLAVSALPLLILTGGLIFLIRKAMKKRQALLAQQQAEEAALLAALENAKTEREFEIAKIKLQLFCDKINAAGIRSSLNRISSSILTASFNNSNRNN